MGCQCVISKTALLHNIGYIGIYIELFPALYLGDYADLICYSDSEDDLQAAIEASLSEKVSSECSQRYTYIIYIYMSNFYSSSDDTAGPIEIRHHLQYYSYLVHNKLLQV